VEHLVTTIEFQMSLLLFVSLAGYLLASRISQPALVGIIIATILPPLIISNWIYEKEKKRSAKVVVP
jgi:Kef-type K+ transport system membrane component KefB